MSVDINFTDIKKTLNIENEDCNSPPPQSHKKKKFKSFTQGP